MSITYFVNMDSGPVKKKRKNAFHHGDLRAQLVVAVRQLVESKGADGFSVAEAARLAGVSSGAPYKHFKDKPALLVEVAVDGMRRLQDNMTTSADEHERGSLSAVAALGLAYVEFASAEPGIFRLMFGLNHVQDAAALQSIGEQTFALLLREVALHLSEPPNTREVRETAYLLWTHVHGHAFLAIDAQAATRSDRPDDAYYIERVTRSIVASHIKGEFG